MLNRLKAFLLPIMERITYLYRRPKAWKAPEGLFGDRTNVAGVFETIYRKSVWASGSGGGSNPEFVKTYVSYVQTFLKQYSIRSVVDLGCGDWRFSRLIDWDGIKYVGIDVVNSVIEANKQKYQSSNVDFFKANILDQPESIPGADLLLIKDVLQHLSNTNVSRILSVANRYKYVLITNDFASKNIDCNNGDTRPIDISKAPFNCSNAKPALRFYGKVVFLLRNE